MGPIVSCGCKDNTSGIKFQIYQRFSEISLYFPLFNSCRMTASCATCISTASRIRATTARSIFTARGMAGSGNYPQSGRCRIRGNTIYRIVGPKNTAGRTRRIILPRSCITAGIPMSMDGHRHLKPVFKTKLGLDRRLHLIG